MLESNGYTYLSDAAKQRSTDFRVYADLAHPA